jgi:CopG family nickel-responsive transcriptional regulator
MGELLRFGVSMDAELLAAFDGMIRRRQYVNRSEAIRDLVRNALVEQRWSSASHAAGALLMAYNPANAAPLRRITHLQNRFAKLIVARLQVPLDGDLRLEVFVLRGDATEMRTFADKVAATRGINLGTLIPAPL